ncbi:hypothetical protein N9997_01550 [Synechococcus sp. AH-603-L18]|nr:hypothetical protein [Synechococcus sp. AH-603-L18]MDB4338008.1 hypothetical protein [Synechococcus sp. AH-603-L18]
MTTINKLAIGILAINAILLTTFTASVAFQTPVQPWVFMAQMTGNKD